MFQAVVLLAMSLSVETPAVETPNWTEVIGQWISSRLTQPVSSDPSPEKNSPSQASASSETNAGQTIPDDESAAPTPQAAAPSDTTAAESPSPSKQAAHADEPLEAIEESRPDDLDEFAEAASRSEKSVDAEELTESTAGLLSDDGEIDWTTQAD